MFLVAPIWALLAAATEGWQIRYDWCEGNPQLIRFLWKPVSKAPKNASIFINEFGVVEALTEAQHGSQSVFQLAEAKLELVLPLGYDFKPATCLSKALGDLRPVEAGAVFVSTKCKFLEDPLKPSREEDPAAFRFDCRDRSVRIFSNVGWTRPNSYSYIVPAAATGGGRAEASVYIVRGEAKERDVKVVCNVNRTPAATAANLQCQVGDSESLREAAQRYKAAVFGSYTAAQGKVGANMRPAQGKVGANMRPVKKPEGIDRLVFVPGDTVYSYNFGQWPQALSDFSVSVASPRAAPPPAALESLPPPPAAQSRSLSRSVSRVLRF